ncbi:hypothetical protein NBRC111452_2301 [Companilactobacillus farciminis]|nr:hypothetical protein NBRC111452_2301 [Companilactobacillus farciminis]
MSQGLLLVNLGSPASPQTSDVKNIFKNFSVIKMLLKCLEPYGNPFCEVLSYH